MEWHDVRSLFKKSKICWTKIEDTIIFFFWRSTNIDESRFLYIRIIVSAPPPYRKSHISYPADFQGNVRLIMLKFVLNAWFGYFRRGRVNLTKDMIYSLMKILKIVLLMSSLSVRSTTRMRGVSILGHFLFRWWFSRVICRGLDHLGQRSSRKWNFDFLCSSVSMVEY